MDITTVLYAILLGMVEGLTEFIPVSSTGHLILLIDILGFSGPPGKVFEIIIQMGAILAICWFYRKKLFKVASEFYVCSNARRFVFNIAVAFIPSAIIGATFHSFIKSVLFSPLIVSIMLIVGGIAIFIIEKVATSAKYASVEEIPIKTAFFVGCVQTLAIVPGTSRSGATIMGSLLFGLDRKTAAEFSFFLAIPTMLGATVYDICKNISVLSFDNYGVILIGFVTAFIAALIVVDKVISFISNHGFTSFAYYRIVLGLFMLWVLLT